MECNAVKATAALKFICPLCAAVDSDTFEVLDTDVMHAITCSDCGKRLRLMVFECERCAGETALSWSEAQIPEQVEHPVCAHCGHRPNDDEEPIRRMGLPG